MSRTRRIAISLAAAFAATASLFVANAGPALAADKYICNSDRSPNSTENSIYIVAPHITTITVNIDLCVGRHESPSQRIAWGSTTWSGNYVASNPFNSFKLTIRLERADRVELTHTCDLAPKMNAHHQSLDPVKCATATFNNAPKYKWTSDAVVTYDLRGDGKGAHTWNLRGSPELY
jgi:hypothetical protein